MNIRVLVLAMLGFALPEGRSAPDAPRPPGKPGKWTVIGSWLARHPNWKDSIAIRADGTFSRSAGEGGAWRLEAKNDRVMLHLNWDGWNAEILELMTPELFRGETRKGILELRREAGEPLASDPRHLPPEPTEEFSNPTLKERLKDSVWELQDGKQFTLKADGSTAGDWHDRKGSWRIVVPDKLQLTIMWRPQPPVTVTVEGDAALLRWSDAEWAQIAKRVEAEPGEPKPAEPK